MRTLCVATAERRTIAANALQAQTLRAGPGDPLTHAPASHLPLFPSCDAPAAVATVCCFTCAHRRRARKCARHFCVPPHVPLPDAACNRLLWRGCAARSSGSAGWNTRQNQVPASRSLRSLRSLASSSCTFERARTSLVSSSSSSFALFSFRASTRNCTPRIASRTAARTDSSMRHSAHAAAHA